MNKHTFLSALALLWYRKSSNDDADSQYFNEPYLLKDNTPYRLERTATIPCISPTCSVWPTRHTWGRGRIGVFQKKRWRKESTSRIDSITVEWSALYGLDSDGKYRKNLGALENLVPEGSTRDRFLHPRITKKPGRFNGFLVHRSRESAVFCFTWRKFSQLRRLWFDTGVDSSTSAPGDGIDDHSVPINNMRAR